MRWPWSLKFVVFFFENPWFVISFPTLTTVSVEFAILSSIVLVLNSEHWTEMNVHIYRIMRFTLDVFIWKARTRQTPNGDSARYHISKSRSWTINTEFEAGPKGSMSKLSLKSCLRWQQNGTRSITGRMMNSWHSIQIAKRFKEIKYCALGFPISRSPTLSSLLW